MSDTATIILIVLLLIFFGATVMGICENDKIKKEAIRRGYATYDRMGDFTWKEKNE